MTAVEVLILYTRPGCHLCEQAAEMLENLGIAFQEVDIDGDAGLEDKYGLLIPVVRDERNKKELSFPFGEEQLSRFWGKV
jgi:hypothetical protein